MLITNRRKFGNCLENIDEGHTVLDRNSRDSRDNENFSACAFHTNASASPFNFRISAAIDFCRASKVKFTTAVVEKIAEADSG